MATEAEDTTARDDSSNDGLKRELALRWVWPRRQRERLQGARLTVGRDESAHIRLAGPGVSRKHAEIYRQGPLYVVRDLGSTNGTWLGGRCIEHEPATPGSVLRIGEWVGVFVECSAQDPEFCELLPGLFGGPELARLIGPLRRAATTSVPVMLVGGTGTGKELFARAVHDESGRTGAFLPVNCAALPEQLAEAELFGYRRGAFTGADRANLGHFRTAHGGTLFLDELPELSPVLQAKLLRVLERGELLSLGDSTPERVDVRIVSASQEPLGALVQEGRLREDLASRLSGLTLRLPALKERRADIALLFAEMLRRQSGGRVPAVDARLVEALSLFD